MFGEIVIKTYLFEADRSNIFLFLIKFNINFIKLLYGVIRNITVVINNAKTELPLPVLLGHLLLRIFPRGQAEVGAAGHRHQARRVELQRGAHLMQASFELLLLRVHAF